uniref:CID domain-containing protein n=1 Tax=Mucochytrium quahogii TaxID=96639 RepID=A0A7S2WFD1_9STRA|mmetsp:Transcript_12365/g.20071  ORF Transcript_12365/g.20071 Transcript_12365/m.20071 type:complete len:508 (+) Transcript_12365:16-1539(+)
MSFNGSDLRFRLEELHSSQDSITSLSKWIATHNAHVRDSVAVWESMVNKLPSKRVMFLYLANDVIQTTRKTFDTYFVDAFAPAIARAIGVTMRDGDGNGSLEKKLDKLINLWEDRKIMNKEQLDMVNTALRTRGQNMSPVPSPKSAAGAAVEEVDDSKFEDELASSEDEQDVDETAGRIHAARLANTGNFMEFENKNMDKKCIELLDDIESAEFEGITDDLLREKTASLESVVAEFEVQKGWIEKKEDQQESDPERTDDDLYETIETEESVRLDFSQANAILGECEKRYDLAKKRDENMMDKIAEMLEDSADNEKKLLTMRSDMKSLRKRLRIYARQVNKVAVKRKRKQIEEEEEKKRQALEEARIEQEKRDAEKARAASQAASSFLSSFAMGKPPGLPPAHGSLMPPPATRLPPPSQPPPLGGGLSLSMLENLSRAVASTKERTAGPRTPHPPHDPPPPVYIRNANPYVGLYNSKQPFPPATPPPFNPSRNGNVAPPYHRQDNYRR